MNIDKLKPVFNLISNISNFNKKIMYFDDCKLKKGWDIFLKTDKKYKQKILKFIKSKHEIYYRGIQFEMDGIATIILNKTNTLINKTISFCVVKDKLCFLLRSSGSRIQHPSNKKLCLFCQDLINKFTGILFEFANNENGKHNKNHDPNLFNFYEISI